MAGGGGAEGDCPAPGSGTGTDGLVGVAGGAGALGRSRLALARLHHAMRFCATRTAAHTLRATHFWFRRLRSLASWVSDFGLGTACARAGAGAVRRLAARLASGDRRSTPSASRTDKNLCRCFGASARRVFPDHLIRWHVTLLPCVLPP